MSEEIGIGMSVSATVTRAEILGFNSFDMFFLFLLIIGGYFLYKKVRKKDETKIEGNELVGRKHSDNGDAHLDFGFDNIQPTKQRESFNNFPDTTELRSNSLRIQEQRIAQLPFKYPDESRQKPHNIAALWHPDSNIRDSKGDNDNAR